MNYDAMITFANQLAETVSAAKSTAEELASAREEMAALQRKLDSLAADRDGLAARLEHSQESCARLSHERDEVAFAHLEASEALAEANAKLNSFRKLLGMDSGEVAAGAVPASQADPVVTSDPTPNPVPASVGEPVVPEAAGGTGGVEQDRALEVAQLRPTPQPTGDSPVQSSGPTDEPAPEVAEPRHTSPTGDGNIDAAGGTGQSEQGDPLGWRDSPSYVGYHSF